MNPKRLVLAAAAAALLAGCQTNKTSSGTASAPPPAPAPAPVVQPAPSAAPAPGANADFSSMKGPIRIDAGSSAAFTDPNGNVWLADQGFDGGDSTERAGDLAVANTDNPGIYRTEHFGMNSFSCKLPNGNYTVKLHFAETYDGITAAGGRVFSFNVNGQEFKDFDVFAKAGGADRAYVETVPVEVTDGKLVITFTSSVQNPEINGIEIIPD
jgi:Malectin domain